MYWKELCGLTDKNKISCIVCDKDNMFFLTRQQLPNVNV